MADGALPRSSHIRNNIALFKGIPIRDHIDDGSTAAVESTRLREHTPPTESADGPGCRGEPGGLWTQTIHRIIKGSPTARALNAQIGQQDGRYSYTPRGLTPGIANDRWFSDCAYIEGGSTGPNSGGDKFDEFIIYAYNLRQPDLNIVANAPAPAP